MSKVTVSLIKADVGGWPGHASVHPALIDKAEEVLSEAKSAGTLIDFKVMACGDDLELLMTHRLGTDEAEI
ncbi:MAG: fructose 1,6-bisphosphatase, partial [Methanothrix sp.]